MALAEEKKNEELAQLVLIFTNRETTLDQELSNPRQSEKETKKRLFDKGQEYTDLESRVLPLRYKVVEMESEAEATKVQRAKLEERAMNQEVQLGRAEAELTQQAENFKKAEAELIEDVADAYATGFEDALAQVACAHPEMDASLFATSNRVVDGQIVPRAPPSYWSPNKQFFFLIIISILFSFNYLSCLPALTLHCFNFLDLVLLERCA